MGLFDVFKKKDCEICGKEVGMFGYKKLEDGEICKDCVKLLSPWFDDRRHSTVEQIKAQLAYREENKAALNAFRPTVAYGERYTLRAELVNGVSTRGAIALYKASQVIAALEGRDYVIPEDVVREAIPVLAHRVTASSGSRKDAEAYLLKKMGGVAVPLEDTESL